MKVLLSVLIAAAFLAGCTLVYRSQNVGIDQHRQQLVEGTNNRATKIELSP